MPMARSAPTPTALQFASSPPLKTLTVPTSVENGHEFEEKERRGTVTGFFFNPGSQFRSVITLSGSLFSRFSDSDATIFNIAAYENPNCRTTS
ncbi:hypothetical protein M0R45_027360 [Rubus argutus]|uniref:Uncharacterized protein n=1 Tax=Rubus argutus TaxID=59490 RepID=A0AAW1X1Y9_RUBAR